VLSWTDHYVPVSSVMAYVMLIKRMLNNHLRKYVPWLNKLKPLAEVDLEPYLSCLGIQKHS
jgi:hypothetical protein